MLPPIHFDAVSPVWNITTPSIYPLIQEKSTHTPSHSAFTLLEVLTPFAIKWKHSELGKFQLWLKKKSSALLDLRC